MVRNGKWRSGIGILFMGKGNGTTTILGHIDLNTESGVVEIRGRRAKKSGMKWVSRVDERETEMAIHLSEARILWL